MPDEKLAAALTRELAAMRPAPIEVPTADPPPAEPAATPAAPAGPVAPQMSMLELLDQDVWWHPNGKPPVRIAHMDKPWRWNTVRFLERRAEAMHNALILSSLAVMPDDVARDVLGEHPLRWLSEQPLYRALAKGLPRPGTVKADMLADRAKHWNTCPMRKSHPRPFDLCTCVQNEAGRTIGATNDPETVEP